jgi:hypothetical protein
MMDRSYVELEAQVVGHQRALREAARAERLVRAGRSRAAGPVRRARSALAAALVLMAAWLDERYAEREAVAGEWVRIA